MAERNKCVEAVILSLKEAGDKAQAVRVLSPTRGVFTATLWGGGKSRLRQLVQPFYSGDLYIYEKASTSSSPASPTIKDFDAKVFRPSLRESLVKTSVCWATCEVVAATECAGEAERAFKLVTAFLDGIEATSPDGARLSLLRFLRRYSSLLGLARSTTACASCGKPLAGEALVWQGDEGFLCPQCAAYPYAAHSGAYSATHSDAPYAALSGVPGDGQLKLGEEALSYLRAVDTLPPRVSRNAPLSKQAQRDLEEFLFDQMRRAAGHPLKALDALSASM